MGVPPTPIEPRPCKACGELMPRKRWNGGTLEPPSMYKRRLYCDQACMAKGMTHDNPSLSTMRKRNENLPRGDKCETCLTSERLHIHHVDENPFNNALENLMTLCSSCHLKLHWVTGKKMPPRKPCSVKSCDQFARWNGFCGKHWQRYKKYGDPLMKKIQVSGHLSHTFEIIRVED